MNKIKKILLTQPNYIRFGKRTYKSYPYALGIINACINKNYNSDIFDPNINNLDDDAIIEYLRVYKPDLVGVSTISTEYIDTTIHMTNLIKKALPDVIIVEGGTIPTVSIKLASFDDNVDYWIIGEGEDTFSELLNELNKKKPNIKNINGIAYKNKELHINTPRKFIEDLDRVPYPDYGSLDIKIYANQEVKLGGQVRPRENRYCFTLTSRGCCYNCVFCSASRVSGKKVRMRSAENVLKEIDIMYNMGMKEIIFMDDHFLFNKKRAIDIMNGIIERNYDMSWKCLNLTGWLLDEELMDLMVDSGCYQVTISIESGNEYVLKKLMKKGSVNLKQVPKVVKMAKEKGLEIITNLVIGLPYEKWDQIRDTFAYADKIDVDMVNIHIATPLPNTELMEICIKEGLLPKDFDTTRNIGYTKSLISTDEFTPRELHILRAYEWDRLNFRTPEKRKKFADMQGITLEELEIWRKDTRRTLGIPNEDWGK